MLRKKPRRWGLRPALVAPEWRWFWENAVCIFPFWEGAGIPRYYHRGAWKIPSYDTGTPPTWGNYIAGVASKWTDGVTTAGIIVPDNLNPLGTDEITLTIIGYYTDGGSWEYLVDGRNGAGTWLAFNNSSPVALRYNGSLISSSGYTGVTNLPFAITVTDDGTNATAYLDGISPVSVTAAGNPGSNFRIGTSNTGSEDYSGFFQVIAVHNDIKSAKQIAQLHSDPSGPFRMADETSYFASLSAFISGNLSLNHSGASDIGGAIGAAITNDSLNNVWDDVSSGEASAGDTEYRCLYVKNTHASLSAANSRVDISSQPSESTWAIGLGAAGKNGTETAVADESTAPGSVTFGSTPIQLGDLSAGDFYPIWIRRTVAAGAGSATPDSGILQISCDDPN